MRIYQGADPPAWAMRSVITRLDLMKKKESSLTITAVTLPPGTTMDLFRKLAKTIMCFITGLRITVYTADASDAEKIQINEDGTIDEVEMTTQGAESHIPETRVLTASAFCKINGKAYLENYTSATESYEFLTNIHNGDGAYIKYYLFEGKIDKIQVKASNTGLDSQILVHMDGPDGEVVAEIQIGKSKGNYDFAEYEAPKAEYGGQTQRLLEFAGSSGKLMNVKRILF